MDLSFRIIMYFHSQLLFFLTRLLGFSVFKWKQKYCQEQLQRRGGQHPCCLAQGARAGAVPELLWGLQTMGSDLEMLR